MKQKKFIVLVLAVLLMLCLTACGQKLTLDFAFGSRTGTYSGNMTDGLPNGYGKFTTKNDNGDGWTYEGNWSKGHFEGEGKTTWESGEMEEGVYKDDKIVPIAGDEVKGLYADPKSYQNKVVELYGKVFTVPQQDQDNTAIQMWGDPKNSNNNVVVYIPDRNFEVKSGDYVRIIGKVGEEFKGNNAFGGGVTAPTVYAKECEVVSYIEAVSPALSTIEVNQTIAQLGYAVTVQKVELAEDETRIYVKVENNGSDKFSLYSFSSLLVQNGKQFQEQSNWDADYPDIQTDLLVGNTTEGIIAFPKIEKADFAIVLEGHSGNYREDFEEFRYEIQQ